MRQTTMVTLLVVAAVAAFFAPQADGAFLTGTTVTGSLQFPTEPMFPNNYFDPANGLVPPGYGNSAPGNTSVIIATPRVEFGFNNTLGLVHTADFDDTTLTISTTTPLVYDTFRMTFMDAAFANAKVTLASDTYPTATTFALTGSTLTVDLQRYESPGSFSLTFNFTPAAVPEPASALLLGLGVAGVGLAGWRRSQRPT